VYATLEPALSTERLATYLRAAGHDQARAVALYEWNMLVSAAFLPLFAVSEVALRNRIVSRLERNWPLGWWDGSALSVHLDRRTGAKKLRTAEHEIRRGGKTVTSGRLTAELTFGFWTSLLGPHFEPVLWPAFAADFPNLPLGLGRNDLFNRCNTIRVLRNRVSHHEPIFSRDLSRDSRNIIELIRWLDPALDTWMRKQNTVPGLLRKKP
jgi:hypothetical protein